MAKHQRTDTRAAYERTKQTMRMPGFRRWKLLFSAQAVNATACQAAKAIDGTLFTNDEEPQLPLAGCDAKECICSYVAVDPRTPEEKRATAEQMRATLKDYFAAADRLRAASDPKKESH